MSTLSSAALSRGIDAYGSKDFERAATEFRRAIGLAPSSSNTQATYGYLAQTYLKLGKPDNAEATYKEAIKASPSSDAAHLALANFYFDRKRYQEAETEYASAIRLNPSEQNIYSLGQLYLTTSRLDEAEAQFDRVLVLDSRNYGAVYSLGQIERQRGNYDKAISEFRQAIELKTDFAFAYSDLGMAYADAGEPEKAGQQAQVLDSMSTTLANDLRNYIYQTSKPEMLYASTFTKPNLTQGPGTEISSLDSSLASPGASKDFTLTVMFSKEMDRASVENITSWTISKASGTEQGGAYNWGLPTPATDVSQPMLPKNVLYDASSLTATVIFTITQNAAGNGTLDPSHLIFGFSGQDAYGNSMDSSKNEYLGLSIIV
ncbi:MAG: tetratricopeptide repeat protein [Nitrospirales bacterium]|nr:tetratricopeptide repeat protein [Nitrospirales bacterium]